MLVSGFINNVFELCTDFCFQLNASPATSRIETYALLFRSRRRRRRRRKLVSSFFVVSMEFFLLRGLALFMTPKWTRLL